MREKIYSELTNYFFKDDKIPYPDSTLRLKLIAK